LQEQVLALFSDPATHGESSDTLVKRIDTHAAAVFLSGSYAYKIKRVVRFPFLDFSTLEKRKSALQSEIEVNKPFAPQLYLGLVPITRAHGRLKLGRSDEAESEIVEWALKMWRFDETQTLDHLASASKIIPAIAESLGRIVADGHTRAPKVEAAPWISALGDYIKQNGEAFREHTELFDMQRATHLTSASTAAFHRLRPLLEQRGAQGMIRRGHGDLHLGNIALIDGKPQPFDALEFDPLVASGDLLYDLAFLLMDLAERKLNEAAATVLNVYFTAARRDADIEALAALPLFMSVRAAIRAKVTAEKIAGADATKRAAISAEAKDYFALACELIEPPAPKLIAIGGLSGTGKSVLARGLAAHIPPLPGALVLRSDVERKAMFNVAETDKLPAEAYTADVTARIYTTLAHKAHRVIAAGHSTIVDAVFAEPRERAMISDMARSDRLDFQGLFLTADLATRTRRVGSRINDASDAGAEIARRQEDYDLGALDWNTVDASGSPEETLARVRTKLKS
jgi:aminoglycoside phosphotransferase family enzyme/predicted kinase